MFAVCATAPAQQGLPESPATPALDSSNKKIVLKAGTTIVLRNKTKLSSASATVGEEVAFTVIKPVTVDGVVVIAAGAWAGGKIAAVELRGWKGRGARLGISIDRVQLVTGEMAGTRAMDEKQGGNNRANDIGSALMAGPLPGAGAMLIPLLLLEKGNEVEIRPGMRFTAVVKSDVTLEEGLLRRSQPPTATPSADFGEVWIYLLAPIEQQSTLYWQVTCGVQMLGRIDHSNFIHVKLPPGEYWFHSGAAELQMKKMKAENFLRLTVEAGKNYYVRESVDPTEPALYGKKHHLEIMPENVGSEELTETLAPGNDVSPEFAFESGVIRYPGRFRGAKCVSDEGYHLAKLRAQPGQNAPPEPKTEVPCR